MRLDAATVAQIARDVGFVRPELPVAVAIAHVASGGYPHADHRAGMPGCGRYVGLWGIDTDRFGEWTPGDLYDPETAARAAYDLTRRMDGFGWSAHWSAGTDRPHYQLAGEALVRAPYRDVEHVPIYSDLHRGRLNDLAGRAAARTIGHAQWRIASKS